MPPTPKGPVKPAKDPLVEAELERALQRYVGLVPPAMLETMRDILEDALTSHPVAVKLLDHLRERPAEDASGPRPKEGADPAAGAEAESSGRKEGAS
jgi:hypothetical protein